MICTQHTLVQYGQERASTTLTVSNLNVDPDHVSWFFNGTEIAIGYPHWKPEPEIMSPYKNKVEYNSTDYSLMMRNLQMNDSGCYHVEIKLPDCRLVYIFYLIVQGKTVHCT